MSNPEDYIYEEITLEYNTPIETVKVSNLKAGDCIHIKTINGSRYVFKIIITDVDHGRRFIKCVNGDPALVNTQGFIINQEIIIGQSLYYGLIEKPDNLDSSGGPQNKQNQTSKIKELQIKETPEIEYEEKIYNSKVEIIEANQLIAGDYIYLKTKNSLYVLQVKSKDKITGAILLKIVGGKNAFRGKYGNLDSNFIQRGFILITDNFFTSEIEWIEVRHEVDPKDQEIQNPFDVFEPSMVGNATNPEVSKQTVSPYIKLEQELFKELQLESEYLTRNSIIRAWSIYEEAFQNHLKNLPFEERIKENLRFQRISFAYEKLLAEYPE